MHHAGARVDLDAAAGVLRNAEPHRERALCAAKAALESVEGRAGVEDDPLGFGDLGAARHLPRRVGKLEHQADGTICQHPRAREVS